jgi:hypothetical protein
VVAPKNGAVGWALLRFFKQIDSSVPRELEVNVVLDNLSAHSTPEIQKWLSHKPSPLAPALHPDVRLVVEPDRTLGLRN